MSTEVLNLDGIRASLERDSGLWTPGDVGHISETALVLEFRREAQVALPLASMREVVLAGGGVASPFHVSARVIGRTEFESKSRYEFHMLSEEGKELVGMINRRMAERIKPSDDEPIRVQMLFDKVGVGEQVVLVNARDVSITGIGVMASEEIEEELYGTDTVRLRIQLPSLDEFFQISARVRNRSLIGREIVYGLMFEGPSREELKAAEANIQAYGKARALQVRASRKLPRR